MPLVTTQWIKDNFDTWEQYCTLDDGSQDPTAVLEKKIAIAEIQLGEYVTVTGETITDQIKRYLLVLVRKQCFDIKHGDTEFDHKPQIVRDYEETLTALKAYRKGVLPAAPDPEDTDHITMTSKDRVFDEWFLPDYGM